MIIKGDCIEEMKNLPDNSVDAVVTDPPYELGFMGKKWDNTGIAYNKEMWAECLRVLKPGGHLLAFSGTRTYHRMAVAIEDAGFEIRDMVEWVYGSGFPKSLNIGKAVDKIQGNEREVVGEKIAPDGKPASARLAKRPRGGEENGDIYGVYQNDKEKTTMNTKGTSPWEGWGTALKPAHEPICLARKKLEGTVANNVLKWGTGGLNIDKSRVKTSDSLDGGGTIDKSDYSTVTLTSQPVRGRTGEDTGGRFPANFIHDGSDEVVREFPNSKSVGGNQNNRGTKNSFISGVEKTISSVPNGFGDDGSAARFFKSFIYCPKASKSERDRGCEGMESKAMHEQDDQTISTQSNRKCVNCGRVKFGQPHCECEVPEWVETVGSKTRNNHPTVKPLALMKYLIQMITPPGGVVLDPFAGSGSTLVAAKELGYDFIGIEMTEEYIPIIEARLAAVKEQRLL